MNHAAGDADLLIVQPALKAAKGYPTVLIAEDTDLLVLALHHFTNEKVPYFTYEAKQSQQLAVVWNIGHAKQILGKTCHGILVFYAFMPSQDVTQHHISIQWESQLFYRNIGKVISFRSWQPFFGPVCKQRRYNICKGTTYAFHNWSHKEREDN